MAKKRTGVRMHPMVEAMLRVLMRKRGFATLTALFEQLARDEWDRRATTPDWGAELARELAVVSAEAKGAAAAIVANDISGASHAVGGVASAGGLSSAKKQGRRKSRPTR